MPRRQLDAALARATDDLYARSLGALAVAAEADRLGLGEVRLAATSPHLVYLVDGDPGPGVDGLAAYATVVLETAAYVTALATYPEWRRATIWAAATVLGSDAAPRAAPGAR